MYYPHYELDLGYTGLTPAIVNNTGSFLAPCGTCWNGYLIMCASPPSRTPEPLMQCSFCASKAFILR